ncbi:hypothetical protein GCM10022403_079720 [Streptomyces coacervatus]|uniref:Uncharacterized protein n=1 Tax=Streptomyces coacervatus TaxID=647381 RepID=A0ABP7J674_9ACTN
MPVGAAGPVRAAEAVAEVAATPFSRWAAEAVAAVVGAEEAPAAVAEAPAAS